MPIPLKNIAGKPSTPRAFNGSIDLTALTISYSVKFVSKASFMLSVTLFSTKLNTCSSDPISEVENRFIKYSEASLNESFVEEKLPPFSSSSSEIRPRN